jgi:hypothetical protein
MPGAKKKATRKSRPPKAGRPAAQKTAASCDNREVPPAAPVKGQQAQPNQRKRGWRDIEAISERARLKTMLSDIWHEDIEIDEEIFGGSDHPSGYYTDLEVEAEIEVDEDEVGEPEEFDEKEK